MGICHPLPLTYAWPPRGQPSRWLTVIHCRQGRALTKWPWWAPSWLTNLETLNRGNRVLPASLPPLAGALGEGQERRKPMNELRELGARGLGQGVGSSKPGPRELSLLRSPACVGAPHRVKTRASEKGQQVRKQRHHLGTDRRTDSTNTEDMGAPEMGPLDRQTALVLFLSMGSRCLAGVPISDPKCSIRGGPTASPIQVSYLGQE